MKDITKTIDRILKVILIVILIFLIYQKVYQDIEITIDCRQAQELKTTGSTYIEKENITITKENGGINIKEGKWQQLKNK